MQLVNDTQRKVYNIDEEAETSIALIKILVRFGIRSSPCVTTYSESVAGMLVIRVEQSDTEGVVKSVVCPQALGTVAQEFIDESGLKSSELKTGIHTYQRPPTT